MVRGTDKSSSGGGASSGGLPKGWKKVLDESTKRFYYWNIETNDVSWTLPKAKLSARAKSSSSSASVASLGKTKNGHNKKGEKPSASSTVSLKENGSSTATPPSLPANWEAVLDSNTGRHYYWNRKTGETTWHKPKPMPPKESPKTKKARPKSDGATFGKGLDEGTRLKRATSSMSSGWTKFKERKRRENVRAERFEVEEYTKKNYPKSDRTRELLGGILKKHFLFQGLSRIERNEVVSAMCKKTCSGGEVLIAQGDKGDFFYVVERGKFDVLVAEKGKPAPGKRVGQIEAGGSFGELALMYSCPRAATILAKTKCSVWALDRATFRHMLQASSHKDMEETLVALRKVHILHNLTDAQLNKCAEAVRFVEFVRGERIIHKGDAGDVFYIIRSGTVICSGIASIDGQTTMELTEGDYFGERALLTDEPRAADVTAKGDVSVMVLNRHDFVEILGPLRDILDANIRMSVLKREQLFKCLDDAERQKIFDAFTMKTFEKDAFIIRQGDEGNCFYVMREGEAQVTQDVTISGVTTTTDVHVLQTGDYFGEMALKEGGKRQASVIAKTRCECFALDRAHFESLLGPASEILDRVVRLRKEENFRLSMASHQSFSQSASSQRSLSTSAPARPKVLSKQNMSSSGSRRTMDMMGQIDEALDTYESGEKAVVKRTSFNLKDLNAVCTLGTGTFGRVKLVTHATQGGAYALKIQSKAQIAEYKLQTNIVNEKKIMVLMDHPFILKLHQTFKDRDKLYMLLEIVQGGELFSLLQTKGPDLTPSEQKFYVACVVSAFKYMHSMDILYRDLKPENLLIDAQGYLKVVDFGFAKVVKHRTYTLCGTPEYFSPELVLGKGYGKGNDYWAIGILAFEVVFGYTPFGGIDDEQTVICRRICQSKFEFPDDYTDRSTKSFNS